VLSSQEQRIWDDVQRFWAEEAEEPTQPELHSPSRTKSASRGEDDLPVAVVAGARVAIILVLFGAVLAGVALAVATPSGGRSGAPGRG